LPKCVNWACFGKDIFMRTEDRDPVQQADQTGSTQVDEHSGHRVKVAKFVGQIFGENVDVDLQSFHTLLDARSVASTESTAESGSSVAPDAPSTVTAEELVALSTAIDRGKSQIGIWGNFLIGLKTFCSGTQAGNAETSRQIFKNLDKEQQHKFLRLVLQHTASQQNTASNVKIALEFFRAAGVTESNVSEAIRGIPHSHLRVKIFKELAQPTSGFIWHNLTSADVTQIALDLSKDEDKGRDCFMMKVLPCLPTFKGAAAEQVFQNLANAGTDGAFCLEQFLAHGSLVNLPSFEGDEAKQVILNLARAGSNGRSCAQRLHKANKLCNLPEISPAEAKRVFLDLIKEGPLEIQWLDQWTFKNKKILDTLSPFKGAEASQVILDLIRDGPLGVKWLTRLTWENKFKLNDIPAFEGEVANQVFLDLIGEGPEGIYYAQQLYENNKLPSLNLTPEETNYAVKRLASNGLLGAKYITWLYENNKLTNLDLDSDAANWAVQNLLLAGSEGAKCITWLYENNKLTNLDLDSKETNYAVRTLLKAGPEGIQCLKQLFEGGKMQNFRPKGLTSPEEIKTKALELLGKDPPDVGGLTALLEEPKRKRRRVKNRLFSAGVGQ
jgi:hypothetical protein